MRRRGAEITRGRLRCSFLGTPTPKEGNDNYALLTVKYSPSGAGLA